MHHSIWQAIASTPWWVAILFIYAACIGYRATKPYEIPLRNLMLSACLLSGLTAIALSTHIPPTPANLGVWANMMLFGAGISWLHLRIKQVKISPDGKRLEMPGSWNIFLIMIVILVIKYYMGFQFSLSFNPDLLKSPKIAFTLMALYGLFTGSFLGRIAYARHAAKQPQPSLLQMDSSS